MKKTSQHENIINFLHSIMSSRTIFFKNCPTERKRGEKNCPTERNRDEKKSSPEGGGVAPIRIIIRCQKNYPVKSQILQYIFKLST